MFGAASTLKLSLHTLLAATILALSAQPTLGAGCVSQTAANPIWKDHFTGVTGVINETISVLPIPYTLARSIIPAKYDILPTYKDLLPPAVWPEDKYPLVLETRIDHDVRSLGINAADFSSVRLLFPFVDRVADGKSAFTYAPTIILSSSIVAEVFSTLYGEKVIVSTFEPECDAYAGGDGKTTYTATSIKQGAASVNIQYSNLQDGGPYPLAL